MAKTPLKILVLGSTGMLGHQVVNYLSQIKGFAVYDFSFRSKLRPETKIINATNQTVLEQAIVKLKPDFIINCIGVLIKGSKDIANAIYLNAYLPHKLAATANKIGAKFVHISTDCVFSGAKGSYVETDTPDGTGVYAQTKILGEIIDDKNTTLRTGFIGPELKTNGEGLFHWFMQQNDTVQGFTNSFWSGVTTLELAKAIKWAIDCNITGLYHITHNQAINKNDLLNLIKKNTNVDIEIIPVSGKNVDKSLLDTKKLLNYKIPNYDLMIANIVDNVRSNWKLYPYSNLR